jgi:SnoaL-like domain
VNFDEIACKVECHDLLVRLCSALDSGANPDAADLFVADATLVLATGAEVCGPDIRGHLLARSSEIVTRHLLTNVLVTPHSGDRATADASILVYRVGRDGDVLPRVLPTTPQGVGEWHVEFRRTPLGWRLGRLATVSLLAAQH